MAGLVPAVHAVRRGEQMQASCAFLSNLYYSKMLRSE